MKQKEAMRLGRGMWIGLGVIMMVGMPWRVLAQVEQMPEVETPPAVEMEDLPETVRPPSVEEAPETVDPDRQIARLSGKYGVSQEVVRELRDREEMDEARGLGEEWGEMEIALALSSMLAEYHELTFEQALWELTAMRGEGKGWDLIAEEVDETPEVFVSRVGERGDEEERGEE